MDSFSAQEISSQQVSPQQVPIQPAEPFVQSPIQKHPQQKVNLKKILNLGTWMILFALLPITVLIFLSQDSIPGDYFYPVKRGMENVILAAASVSPATRAAFRTDLTETRFKEAQGLVVSKSNTSGLTTFIDEVQSAQLEVVSLKDDTQRIKAEEKLINKLEEYQAGLSTLEAKTEQNLITYQSQEAPMPTFTPTPTLIPTPTSLPSSQSKSSPTSTPIPTSTPTLTPTMVQTAPTAQPQQENAQITEQKKIAQTIKETKEQLHKIKKDLEEKKGKNKNENENKNKNNSNKKTDANTNGYNPQEK